MCVCVWVGGWGLGFGGWGLAYPLLNHSVPLLSWGTRAMLPPVSLVSLVSVPHTCTTSLSMKFTCAAPFSISLPNSSRACRVICRRGVIMMRHYQSACNQTTSTSSWVLHTKRHGTQFVFYYLAINYGRNSHFEVATVCTYILEGQKGFHMPFFFLNGFFFWFSVSVCVTRDLLLITRMGNM